ncbi:MAG: twin-arginine translocase TatA/TatE family subunit [Acidobacteria bacterium]|nr:twin-arginine translocase TatA/TatE family subunit [Acidobacteriota bacterium]MCA1618643.1 twin-arginine translocase TatA/TatE family subunit [Acidobacteriota bacterium]
MYLLFLESIGTTELLVVLFFALLVLGPRKLPEMARKLGGALNHVRNASDDLKRTWEFEARQEGGAQRSKRLREPRHSQRRRLPDGLRGVEAVDTGAAPAETLPG